MISELKAHYEKKMNELKEQYEKEVDAEADADSDKSTSIGNGIK